MSRENRTGGKGKPRPWVRPTFDTGTRVHKDGGKLRREEKRSHDWRDWMADTEKFDDLENEDPMDPGLEAGLESEDSPGLEDDPGGEAPGGGPESRPSPGYRIPLPESVTRAPGGTPSPARKQKSGKEPSGPGKGTASRKPGGAERAAARGGPPDSGKSRGSARPQGAGKSPGGARPGPSDRSRGSRRQSGASGPTGKGGAR